MAAHIDRGKGFGTCVLQKDLCLDQSAADGQRISGQSSTEGERWVDGSGRGGVASVRFKLTLSRKDSSFKNLD